MPQGGTLVSASGQNMSIVGSGPVVSPAASRRAQVSALLSKGLPAPALIALDSISALGVPVLSTGGRLRVVVGGTADGETGSFILSPLRLVALLLGESQCARVEVAASRLPLKRQGLSRNQRRRVFETAQYVPT